MILSSSQSSGFMYSSSSGCFQGRRLLSRIGEGLVVGRGGIVIVRWGSSTSNVASFGSPFTMIFGRWIWACRAERRDRELGVAALGILVI